MFPVLDTDTFTYAFMDYRGYGKSRSIPGKHTMGEISSDAIALADHLGWKRFHVVGHSMGGMAVQRVAVDARARVKSGVAVTPVPASGTQFEGELWELFSGAPDNDENRRRIVDHSVSGRLTPRWVDMIVRDSRETSTRDAYADYLVAFAKTDFSPEAGGLTTPFKVIVGEFDPALNPEFMRRTFLAWYPNAELEIIANSGHYPMQETPVYLATSMESFMKAHR
jgi:pimeloyl-ACP methyl ester carboxylesterase